MTAPSPSRRPVAAQIVFVAVALFALVYGLVDAYEKRWLCDDIFVTFRYVQNWLSGNGIVYNAGERVEGYTHVLWMCLIAFFQWLGASPESVVQTLGLLAYAGTLLTSVFISWRLSRSEEAFLPLTAVLLALQYEFGIWATSGLETSFFTFLILLSVWTLTLWRTTEEKSAQATGAVLAAAMLLRPDAVLIIGWTGVVVVWRTWSREGKWKPAVRMLMHFLLPVLAVVVPHLVWRYSYYGALLPNTYYAKNGGSSYWGQGFFYIWVYFKAYWSAGVALAGAALLFVGRPGRGSRSDRVRACAAEPRMQVAVLGSGTVLVYGVLFIARVGGDFMYARFLHPLIPLMYTVGEIAILHVSRGRRWALAAGALLLVVIALTDHARRDALFVNENGTRKPAFQLGGIADEYWFWGETTTAGVTPIVVHEMTGKELARFFEGEHVRMLLKAQLSLGYYGGFSECIESTGLTDSYIARLPLDHRGRPGHEHEAPLSYLEERKIHFVFFSPPYDSAEYRQMLFHTRIGIAPAEMITYDAPLMQRLHARFPHAIEFVDFPRYLDEYCRTINARGKETVARDYEKFRRYYFNGNPDRAREERIRRKLGK